MKVSGFDITDDMRIKASKYFDISIKNSVYNAAWTRQPEKPYLINQFHTTYLYAS